MKCGMNESEEIIENELEPRSSSAVPQSIVSGERKASKNSLSSVGCIVNKRVEPQVECGFHGGDFARFNIHAAQHGILKKIVFCQIMRKLTVNRFNIETFLLIQIGIEKNPLVFVSVECGKGVVCGKISSETDQFPSIVTDFMTLSETISTVVNVVFLLS